MGYFICVSFFIVPCMYEELALLFSFSLMHFLCESLGRIHTRNLTEYKNGRSSPTPQKNLQNKK